MAESNEIESIAKISLETDEIRIQFLLSSYFLKAQDFLDKKLQDERNQLKEKCEHMANCNLKLESEIKQSEQEFISLNKAHEVVKSSKIQAKVGFLAAKEKNLKFLEHVKKVEVKYDNMWLESKERFEKLPIVRQWLQATNKTEALKNTKAKLEIAIQAITIQIKDKKNILQIQSRKNIIQLAEFFIHDMPAKNNLIKEKSAEYNKLTREIKQIYKQQQIKNKFNKTTQKVMICNTKENFARDSKCTTIVCDDMMMPKLQFQKTDFDDLNIKLDQIKEMVKQNTNPIMNIGSETHKNITFETKKTMDNTSSYLNEYSLDFAFGSKLKDYSEGKLNPKRKLIHILEDIKLNETSKKLNIQQLQGVNTSNAKATENESIDKADVPMEDEQIEEIDLTNRNTDIILFPPTQFMDQSQVNSGFQQQLEPFQKLTEEKILQDKNTQLKVSQEGKKMVSFDLPIRDNLNTMINENYTKIRDMMWKRNLDLSPQFTYTKNTVFQNMKDDNKTVTSKFFNQKDNLHYDIDKLPEETISKNIQEASQNANESNQNKNIKNDSAEEHENIFTDISEIVKQNTNPFMNIGPETNKDITFETQKIMDTTSSYFKKYSLDFVFDSKPKDNSEEKLNSKRKLIHILEDIKLNKTQSYNPVSKVNIQQLQGVNTIGAKATENETIDKADEPMEDEQIEEIDLTNNTENILLPPSQFVDKSQNDKEQRNHNVSGLLFNHGPEGILNSLDLTIGTTDCEDGDADFQHCIDPNLLLSPKADLAIPATSSNAETNSHEIPNFLSEVRKTSFFKTLASSDPKQTSGSQNKETNFNFNFRNEDKNRGGLFSMFH